MKWTVNNRDDSSERTIKMKMHGDTGAALLRNLPILMATCLALSPAMAAPSLPDAGRISRELERKDATLENNKTGEPALNTAPETQSSPAGNGAKITVKGFRITGATVFGADTLKNLLTDLVGKALGLEELEAGAARITHHYRQRGYLVARAYLPAQKISDGMIEIAVLEGRLGNVAINNQSRLEEDIARRYLSDTVARDTVISSDLEKGLLLLSELPGVGGVSAALQPGASVGLSDLAVTLKPTAAVSGGVDVDNYGNRYTGSNRLGGTLNLVSPLRRGDLLILRAQVSEESLTYGRIAYQLPVGANGMRLGFAWSGTHYELGKDLDALDASGSARIGSIWVNYPFVRTQYTDIKAILTVEDKQLHDRVNATATTTDKHLHLVGLGIVTNGYKAPRAAWGASLNWIGGQLDIESPVTRAIDATTAKSHGGYSKIIYDAAVQAPIGKAWSLYGSLNGQFAGKNLDSSEKFSLGGATAIRAYPQGEAMGDEGYVATLEARYYMPAIFSGTLMTALFIDNGRVRVNHANFSAEKNNYDLSATGLGLSWESPGGLSFKASVAWRLNTPEASSDVDRNPRFWVQMIKSL